MTDSNQNYDNYLNQSEKHNARKEYEKSLEALKAAYEIRPSEQLQIKINKLEDIVSETVIEEIQDENRTLVGDKFYVNTKSYEDLHHYQKAGILWLIRLFEAKKGGILADEMGLEKSHQVIFFLRKLFESRSINCALIVATNPLLVDWVNEFNKLAPGLTVLTYMEKEREQNLNKVRLDGGILLTSYNTMLKNWEKLNGDPEFKWNVLALDEGETIKEPSSKTFKAVYKIRADMRLVMTDTAVQNQLKELWALFDFTHQGTLLGSYRTFSHEYERPITASQCKKATSAEKADCAIKFNSLQNLIKTFFLRRTKEEVAKSAVSGANQNSAPQLTRRNDLILWVKMTEKQIDIYRKFLQLDEVKKRSSLVKKNILQKICDHPCLLPAEHCAEMGLTFAESIRDVDIAMLQQESGKMEVLLALLKKLIAEGHRCLVFSQSKVVLDIVAHILRNNNIEQLRLDDDVEDRQGIVNRFNTDLRYKVLLLTSQVVGVGLTLTGADRAIIYDLSWKLSIDAQAVNCIYRIRQTHDVIAYQLVSCGTIEEKIYRRQIFKDSLNQQTTGIQATDQNPYRYFTQGELLGLFSLDDPQESKTQILLAGLHSKIDQSLKEHLSWLSEQPALYGVSHHDLMLSQAAEEEGLDTVDEETRQGLQDNSTQTEEQLMKEESYGDEVDGVGRCQCSVS